MIVKQTLMAHFLLLMACFVWGSAYTVGKFGLSEGSALWLTLWRWIPGAIIFAVYLAVKWRDLLPIVFRYWFRLVLISALGIVIFPVTLLIAVAETTVLNASLYLAVTPVLIVLASSVVWKDSLGMIDIIAVTLGLLGAIVLIFQGSIDALISFKVAENDIWAILSALVWAAYCVALPIKPDNLNEVSFLAIIVVMGTIILLILGLTIGSSEIPFPKTPTVAWSIVYFAIFPSIFAFLAWNWGTMIVGSSVAAPYNNLISFLGGVFGIVFLSESVETFHIVGGTLIIIGLLINGFRRSGVSE